MNHRTRHFLTAMLTAAVLPVALLRAQAAESAPSEKQEAKQEPAKDASYPWLTSLDEGYRQALTKRQPIVVRVGGEACPWCQKLKIEIEKAAAKDELSRWTLVYIDVDKTRDNIRQLAVGPIPALRLLTPRGRVVESHDGYLDAERLVIWLRENHAAAAGASDDLLLATGEPSAVEVMQLVRQFDERSAAQREAAVRRLLPYPAAARTAVIKSLREGNLSTKLTAIELLAEWDAPLEGLDPWRTETLNDERLALLDNWSQEFKDDAADAEPQPLTEKQLTDARGEIQRMLRASPGEVVAIRERLARLGEPLLPEVYARLQEVELDQDRERLLALRYRLVIDGQLVLRWPGGLERLAATSVKTRHEAADELAKMATAHDHSLLLELFSDSDPLVREISLRGLRSIGGKQTSAALVKLLADPEPNVRAAVLKQLAEDADITMIGDVARYVETEKDADLLVHAIRFFRETKEATVVIHLTPLLEHESWQVRAEATEAIGKIISGHQFQQGLSKGSSKTYDKIIRLLDDPDAFVVAKAMEAVGSVDTKLAVEPLIAAAKKHPELTSEIVDVLSSGENMRDAALPHLKSFSESKNAIVRVAAIRGLCAAAPKSVEPYLLKALDDESSAVRIAAAESFLKMMDNLRPVDEQLAAKYTPELTRPDPFARKPRGTIDSALRNLLQPLIDSDSEPKKPAVAEPAEPLVPKVEPAEPDAAEPAEPNAASKDSADAPTYIWDQWLTEIHGGKHRPKWTAQIAAPLENMLKAEDRLERLAAGLALVPLGKADVALPVMLEAAENGEEFYYRAASALQWMAWKERESYFLQLETLSKNKDTLLALTYALGGVNDDRSADLYWRLLQRGDATREIAEAVRRGLRAVFFGDNYWDTDSVTPRMKKDIAEKVKPRAMSGPPFQRLVALNFLMGTAPDEAIEIAKQISADSSASDDLRTDAFQIMLLAQPQLTRTKTAINALRQRDRGTREVALAFLAYGPETLSELRGSGFDIDAERFGVTHVMSFGTTQKPIIPDVPRQLTLADVRPLLDDPDPEIAAYAGYLVSLLRDSQGLVPLVRYWRSLDEPNQEVDRLLYRAIAVLDDPNNIPLLKEIYRRQKRLDMRDFYWTIRIMGGPDILKFRQQLRQEVGKEAIF